ncbi:MAG: CHRD domain-containing protein [Longimonas sp.]|uniref:CHRD domain-containing protein n=1 Tax=Longimonas sp. TaxID=2039626 RepID=UPI00335BE5F0
MQQSQIHSTDASLFLLCFYFFLSSALFFITACDSDSDRVGDDPDDNPDPGPEVRQVTYDLPNVEGNGITGSDATTTFQEFGDQTLVTPELEDGTPGTELSHTAHIHENDVATTGGIAFYLGPIDGSDPDSRSSMLIGESFDTLTDFDGYINIHESVANLAEIVSQGNIGANADDSNNDNGGGY